MGLPVQIAQGQPRHEAWGEQLVDIVRVEILDWFRDRVRNRVNYEEAWRRQNYL